MVVLLDRGLQRRLGASFCWEGVKYRLRWVKDDVVRSGAVGDTFFV